jgi:sec-independent protein translocase protein TatA
MNLPGHWEWIIILFVILLLFGGRRLPELAKGLGKGIKEFKKATKNTEDEFKELDEGDKEKKEEKGSSKS